MNTVSTLLLLGIPSLNVLLAHSLVVNIIHGLPLGTTGTDLGIQALIVLDYLFGESEEISLSPITHY
jgi:hypothetical protein